MIKLSKRLEKVASKVNKKSIVLDVGTDHALLPMYLTKQNIAKKVIASDVVPQIVEKSKKAVAKEKLDDKVKVVLSDGLKDIDDKKIIGEKIDTIVIAGMGGILITEIIKARRSFVKDKRLVLSPHRDAMLVRKYLHEIGFKILSEDIIEDRENKFYNIIVAKEGKDSNYSDIDYALGKKLINKKYKDKDFEKYLKFMINKNKNIYNKLKSSKTENVKMNDLLKETQTYSRILKEAISKPKKEN